MLSLKKSSCAGENVNTININKRKVKNGRQKKETEEATGWKKRTKNFIAINFFPGCMK